MYDLMYCGDLDVYNEITDIVRREYPDADIREASDETHRYRFSVDTKDEDDGDEWVKFTMREKLLDVSFHLTLLCRDPDQIEKVLRLLDEVKAE